MSAATPADSTRGPTAAPGGKKQLKTDTSHFVFTPEGVAIAERLVPFKVKKFIYADVAPRPELAALIGAEYGEDAERCVSSSGLKYLR